MSCREKKIKGGGIFNAKWDKKQKSKKSTPTSSALVSVHDSASQGFAEKFQVVNAYVYDQNITRVICLKQFIFIEWAQKGKK